MIKFTFQVEGEMNEVGWKDHLIYLVDCLYTLI